MKLSDVNSDELRSQRSHIAGEIESRYFADGQVCRVSHFYELFMCTKGSELCELELVIGDL